MGRRANWPPKVIPHSSGQDRVQFGGKTYYLGKSGSPESRAAYVELIGRLATEERIGDSPGLTVLQVAAFWYIRAQSECTPQECDNYRHALAPLVALHGNVPAAQIAGPHLRAVQQDMIARRWKRSHINRSVGRIRTVWRWAEEEGHVPAGSWSVVSAVKPLGRPRPGIEESRPVQPVPWVSVAHAAYIGAPAYLRLYLLLAWWCGARPGELARLRVKDIDQRGETWLARVPQHKNAWRGHERVIVFGPEARHLLEWRLLDATDPDDLVCPTSRGEQFTRSSLGLAIARACKRAGVPHFHSYQLRHAFRVRVTRLSGMDAARILMGHRSIDTTARYGAGADMGLAIEAARKAG